MNISDQMLLELVRARLQDREKLMAAQSGLLREIAQLSEKLANSERVKTNFLSNIRNEINNPLTSALGLTKVLAEEENQTPGNHRLLDAIYNDLFTLDFQLRNIMAAAEIEAGSAIVLPAVIQVDVLIQSCAAALMPRAKKKNIDLQVHVVPATAVFISDSNMLGRIVTNLLANAIEFSTCNSTVGVTVVNETDTLVLSIKDTGSGIADDMKDKIFQRFYQVDQSSTKEHGGHGLGLSVTKEFVELLGGIILVDSSSATGSVFTVTLPSLLKDKSVQSFSSSDDENMIFFGNSEIL